MQRVQIQQLESFRWRWEKISQAMGLINNLTLEIYDKANVTMQEIYVKARKLKCKYLDKNVLIGVLQHAHQLKRF